MPAGSGVWIRCSDETFERLQRFARPLVDTADDALSRVLDIAEKHSPPANLVSGVKELFRNYQPESADHAAARPAPNMNSFLA